MTNSDENKINDHISFRNGRKYDSYYLEGRLAATHFYNIKHSCNVYIHHDVLLSMDDIKKFGLAPNYNYSVKAGDWYSLQGRMNPAEIVELLSRSKVFPRGEFTPDKGIKSIVSFPAGGTYDCVLATDVYARPINKSAPSIKAPYLMVRGKGGLSEYLYEIMDVVELNPYDAAMLDNLLPQYEAIKSYIYLRERIYGFSDAPTPYKFYLLKKVYEFIPSFKPGKNLQGFVYYSLDSVGIDTSRIHPKEFSDEFSYEFLTKDKNNRSTLVINGKEVGRVHFFKNRYPWINVYPTCELLPESVIKNKGLEVEYNPSNKSVKTQVFMNTNDQDAIARLFFEICDKSNWRNGSAISSTTKSRRRESLKVDGTVMAEIQDDGNKTVVYTSRELSTDLGEIKEMFGDGFSLPRVVENPEYSKNNADAYYAKVEFDSSVPVQSIRNAIVERVEHEKQISAQIAEEDSFLERYLSDRKLTGVDKAAVVKVRVNQGVFRDRLIRKYESCCLCGADDKGLLIASHIKPWAESDPKERIDVNNGLLLCPNHDRLFDKNYISFDDDGHILISDMLSEENRILLNVHEDMRIKMTDEMTKYMAYHRENKYKKRKIDDFL